MPMVHDSLFLDFQQEWLFPHSRAEWRVAPAKDTAYLSNVAVRVCLAIKTSEHLPKPTAPNDVSPLRIRYPVG